MEKPAPARLNGKVYFTDEQQGSSRKRKKFENMETEESTRKVNLEESSGPSTSVTTGMTARPDRKQIEKEGSLPLSSCSSFDADNSYMALITPAIRNRDAATSTSEVQLISVKEQKSKKEESTDEEPPTPEVIHQCVDYLLHLKEILQKNSKIIAAEKVYIHFPPQHSDKKHPKVIVPVMLAAMSDGTKCLPFVLLPQQPEKVYKEKLNWLVCPESRFTNKSTLKFLETIKDMGDGRKLLVWRSNIIHLTDHTKNTLPELGIEGITIPDEAIELLHPMYVPRETSKRVSWKRKFISKIGEFYNQWLDQTKPKDPPTPREYMKWIYTAWKLVSSESIKDLFTACGLGNDEDDNKLFCFQNAPIGLKLLQEGKKKKQKIIVKPSAFEAFSHPRTLSTTVVFVNYRPRAPNTKTLNSQSSVSPERIKQKRLTAICDKILKKKYPSREAEMDMVQQNGREDSGSNAVDRELSGTHEEATKVAFPQLSNNFANGASETSASPAPTDKVSESIPTVSLDIDHMTSCSSRESRKRKILNGNSGRTSKKMNVGESESGLELVQGPSEGSVETSESTFEASKKNLKETSKTDIPAAPRTDNVFRSLSLPGTSNYQRDIQRGHEVQFIKFLIDISKTEKSPLSPSALMSKYRALNHGVHLSVQFFNKQLKAERLLKRIRNLEIHDQVPILYITQVPIPNSFRTEIQQEFEAVTFNSNGRLMPFYSSDMNR